MKTAPAAADARTGTAAQDTGSELEVATNAEDKEKMILHLMAELGAMKRELNQQRQVNDDQRERFDRHIKITKITAGTRQTTTIKDAVTAAPTAPTAAPTDVQQVVEYSTKGKSRTSFYQEGHEYY